jgi:hypothetical protein
MRLVRSTRQPRRLRYRLRTLLLIVGVVGLVCGWLSIRLRRAHQQAHAVAAIEAAGGYVDYNYHRELMVPEGEIYISTDAVLKRPRGPEFLRNMLGHHFFHKVTEVQFTNKPLDDLSLLSQTTDIHTLVLRRIRINDLSPIVALRQLEYLEIFDAQVHDLSPLSQLPRLKTLILSRVPVADSDLVPLFKLDSLEQITLVQTSVTATGTDQLHVALPDCEVYWDGRSKAK